MRRSRLTGSSLAAILLALTASLSTASAATPGVAAVEAQAFHDLWYHWWNPTPPTPHLRPTRGTGSIDNAAPRPTFWQMATLSNDIYWQYKLTGQASFRTMLGQQYAYVRNIWTVAELSSAEEKAGLIFASDDGALAVDYFVQINEALGDPNALQISRSLLRNVLHRFADPNHGGTGILYVNADGDQNHQGVATLFSAILAHAALAIYAKTHEITLLNYAKSTFSWTRRYLKHPSGVYFVELDIRPTIGSKPNPNYRKPVGWSRPQDIKRGGSVSYLAGTMGVACLAAELYRQTGDEAYFDEAKNIVSGMARPDTFLRQGKLFVDDRDGWTDGIMAPYFVEEVLSLPAIDPNGTVRDAMVATGLAIATHRTPDGFYGADWSGPEWDPSHRWDSWVAQGQASAGLVKDSGAGMAEPAQAMTSAQSVAMIIAAALLQRHAP